MREFLTPADWERIFGSKSNRKPGPKFLERRP